MKRERLATKLLFPPLLAASAAPAPRQSCCRRRRRSERLNSPESPGNRNIKLSLSKVIYLSETVQFNCRQRGILRRKNRRVSSRTAREGGKGGEKKNASRKEQMDGRTDGRQHLALEHWYSRRRKEIKSSERT